MNEPTVDRDELLSRLPPIPAVDHAAILRKLIQQSGRKVIVLDDDPTGTQTVHGIPVVTRWSVEHLTYELKDPAPASYVLTNSRSLPTTEAVALNREIAENLREARRQTGRDFTLISRSDSTLRGHFPEELDALTAGLQEPFDAWVICPFFEEGGRLTIDDIHYVAEGDRLVPAALTPFAADQAFGYKNSNLRHWVVEKTAGRVPLGRIESLSLQELRCVDRTPVCEKLRSLIAGSACIVNAVVQTDLEAAVAACLEAEAQGKRFLYRTAASFVSVRSGIERRPLLTPAEMATQEGTGVLIVVGSYVPKTTAQLDHLLKHSDAVPIELDVRQVLDASTREAAVSDLARRASDHLAADAAVVVYTSRKLVEADADESLVVGQTISRALVDVVRSISVRPRLLVAKGGITSSDIATQGCDVERAVVLGQALPGVPVWRCGPESRLPGLPLVVFPGNVGDVDALAVLIATWRGKQ
ncbi:MAG TPA: four-carbon acid sugar kinase family protein [Thermoguttaceae bacterium]|nr:four-carbon acid sugar kinase family protein [Thermoguttaceae bacterium]